MSVRRVGSAVVFHAILGSLSLIFSVTSSDASEVLSADVAEQPGVAAPATTADVTAIDLDAGEFVWRPEQAPTGNVLIEINLAEQRAMIYRNGALIGITTISTGRPGYETPSGVFTILQKRKEHYSNLYDDAPMPYMQRLTWGGVALHGGDLPGYPASHGCIRLPHGFARLLYDVTTFDTVVVIDDVPVPSAPAPATTVVASGQGSGRATAGLEHGPSVGVSLDRFKTTAELNRAMLARINGG